MDCLSCDGMGCHYCDCHYCNNVELATPAVQRTLNTDPSVASVNTIDTFTRDPGRTNRCIQEILYDFNSPTGLMVRFMPHGGVIHWFCRHHSHEAWHPVVERCLVWSWFKNNKVSSVKVVLFSQYS